ncbi:MAG: hypothetical protein OXT68_08750 [Chloroflexota bacterium]|nr:hypothetical protein [Chloroflexota bacterium]
MDTHPVKETTVEIDAFCSIDGFGFCMRAGATLQVIGAFNRWLKISHNGGEAWMADWVSHSRVEDSASCQLKRKAQRQLTTAASSTASATATRTGQTATGLSRMVNAPRQRRHRHQRSSPAALPATGTTAAILAGNARPMTIG